MREAALVPLPAIAGSEEAAPGDSGLLAREVVASAVGVAVARLGVVRLAAGLVVAVLGVGAAAVGRPLVARARLGGEVLEVCSLDQPLAPLEGAFERGRAAESPSDERPDRLVVVPEDACDDGGDGAGGEVAAGEDFPAPVRQRAGVCASRLAAEQERGDGRGDGAEDSEGLLELALLVAARPGALTLTHLRGSTDYRSCQHLAQRSVLTQLNGSPKTSVNTAVNTVLKHPPGKTRVYLQKTGYTREIPGSASMPRAPYSQGPCANCGGTDLSAQYAHWTMYCPRVEEGGRDAAPACLLPRRRRCRHPAVELTRTSSQTVWEL